MANIKISDLTSASAVADANQFEINEAGTSKKVTGSQIKAYVNSGDGSLASKNTVATADIDNLAVTTGKLAADAVDGTKIADDAIGNEHIATDAVNADSIAANAVGASELNVPGNGTAGQYLASDGDGTMTWTTLAAGGGFSNMQVFNNPGTWTNPGNVEKVKVTVVGGGGGGSAPIPINVGQTLSAGTGGTSSFGAYCSATGGDGAVFVRAPQPGVFGAGGSGGLGSGGSFNVRGGSGHERSRDYSSFSGGNSLVGGGAFSANRYNGGANTAPATTGGGGAGSSPGYQYNAGGGGGGAAVEVIPFPTGTNVPVTVGGAGNALGTCVAAASGIVIVEY